MTSELNILHLEDNPNDAELAKSMLEAAGIHCSVARVQDRDAFVAALACGGIDLILSDVLLPGFSGLSALAFAHSEYPDLPFILVSGNLGEEVAIELLKSGATDYVLKDGLVRLVPAVRRALQEVRERAERKQLEAQFIEAQKMEVMGQLAGGVAHDFNNILAVIFGYCEWSLSKLPEADPICGYVQEILHAAERAAGLTRQLLVFSRKHTVQPVVLDLNDVVKDLDKMLRRFIDENIDMTIVPGAAIGHVKADAGYVGQLLMNLVLNARDAMPNGGRLTIATDAVTLGEEHCAEHPGSVPGEHVMLTVSDTGAGMSEEVKRHMFEALFTTKPKGKGTGLGLATCRTIVQQSGGHIAVASEVGQGTVFRIYFPRVEEALGATVRSIRTEASTRGTETVLVVEDDTSVRHLACGVLEDQGYTVLRASNGQDALHVARAHVGSPICLVVTDLIMPVMGGRVMAEWLKTAAPDLKVLFTSGYTDEAITHQTVLEAGVDFLPKPYTPTTLARKVRAILDEESASAGPLEKGSATDAVVAPR